MNVKDLSARASNPIEISVIVPIFNEAEILIELYDRLYKAVASITHSFEFIFVNDGSRDASLEGLLQLAASHPHVFYINFSRNFGHQKAVSAGLDHCRGDAVVIIDGDLQDPPELIPELYRKHKENYQVVYAKRTKRKGESAFKKTTAKLFYRILKRLTSVEIPVDTGDFRLIDRKVVLYLRQMPEQNKFIRGQIAWLGFRQTHVAYERDERKHGTTGYTFGKMLSFAIDGITGFSNKPLVLVTKLGFIISLLALVLILYAVIAHYAWDKTITGWTSLIVSVLFMGGVQLFSIGIIGEYIGRINTNSQNRPPYIVDTSNLPNSNSEIVPSKS
jgi:dolichol-phosphate mannosyltransferase